MRGIAAEDGSIGLGLGLDHGEAEAPKEAGVPNEETRAPNEAGVPKGVGAGNEVGAPDEDGGANGVETELEGAAPPKLDVELIEGAAKGPGVRASSLPADPNAFAPLSNAGGLPVNWKGILALVVQLCSALRYEQYGESRCMSRGLLC